ncbi:MAG: exodeoxyribonuclease VII large subunit [Campylobacterota bacterium]|nr:exodeoxyribonuclease VII large subunit [Campylobacterota bacterium]
MSFTPISVAELTEQIKTLLESTFIQVNVEGELSRITYHNSGHIYFTLKDTDASISAIMFRGNASSLKFRLEEGLKVLINGAITLYKPSGKYQIRAFSIEPAGRGALALAYEQLKRELKAQGYFDTSIKKSLPKYPQRIALVTSATGAALQDMLRVASSRWPLLHVSIYDVLTQGESAASQISKAIKIADDKDYDIIVIGRGGGSIEDLWAFNERLLAEAIFAAQTPIVSAVGHEIDWLISDEVADLRAPTPSAAMQMILPDCNEFLQGIDVMRTRLTTQLQNTLFKKQELLKYLAQSYQRHSIEQKMLMHEQSIKQLREHFNRQIMLNLDRYQREVQPLHVSLYQSMQHHLNHARNSLLQLYKAYESANPKLRSSRGYAQVSKTGKVTALEALHVSDSIDLMDAEIHVVAEVKEVRFLTK